MIEIGVLDPLEPLSGQDEAYCLPKFNAMLDAWNADRRYIYAVTFTQQNLVPNLQPHTIGPGQGATFAVAQRPVKIVECNIILNTVATNPVRSPVKVRDYDWWANKRAYAVTGTLPTDVYYEEDWPNGSLYFWVIPTIVYPVELWTWTLLSEGQLNTTISLPPGYLDALAYSLAESIAPSYQAAWTPQLETLRSRAVAKVFGQNTKALSLATADIGTPRKQHPRPTFNYHSGLSS